LGQVSTLRINENAFLVKGIFNNIYFRDNPEGKSEETKYEYLLPVSEDFLQLIIILVSERYDPQIGKVEQIDKLKREVIHQLCISPMPHSDIVKNIFSENVSKFNFISFKYYSSLKIIFYNYRKCRQMTWRAPYTM
jgi:hypothetical protein